MTKIRTKNIGKSHRKFHYSGNHGNYQLNGNSFSGKRYQTIEEIETFTEKQNFLYKRALYGLTVYSEEEINAMHIDKKLRIVKIHKKTQRVLNIYKQEVVNMLSVKFITKFFPITDEQGEIKNPICKYFLDNIKDFDLECKNKMSFKDLGITKLHIVNKLLDVGILSSEFTQLS